MSVLDTLTPVSGERSRSHATRRSGAHRPVLRLLQPPNDTNATGSDATIVLERIGGLIWSELDPAAGSDERKRLSRWLEHLPNGQISQSVDLILASAWLSLMDGNGEDAARWATLAEARAGRGWRAGMVGSEHLGVLALLKAWRANGWSDLLDNSSAAFDALPADSRWRPQAGALSGIALAIAGRSLEAAERLIASEELGRALGQHQARADCLATLGLLALDAGRRSEADALIIRAMQVLTDHQLLEQPTSAYSLTVAADGMARVGRSSEAGRLVGRAISLTASMADFAPWLQVEANILQVHTCLLGGEVATSRRLAAQTRELLHQRCAESTLSDRQRDRMNHAERQLAQSSADEMYGSLPFTQAELRILHLLPTHLTFPEMGKLLFVTRHTVKTQALGVYRKLGATSRNQAVERACALGFLTPITIPDALAFSDDQHVRIPRPRHKGPGDRSQ